MNSEAGQSRLIQTARRIRLAVTLISILLFVGFCVAALIGSAHSSWITVDVTGARTPAGARTVTAIAGFLTVAALIVVRSALTLLVQGHAFASPVSRRLRLAAGLMFAASGAAVVLPPIVDAVLAPNGSAGLGMTLSGSDAGWLVSALVFYLMSVLVERAAEFEADSNQIV